MKKKPKVYVQRNTPLTDLEKLNQERFSGRLFALTGRRTSAPGYRCALCHPNDDSFYDLEEENRRRLYQYTRRLEKAGHFSRAPKPSRMNIMRRMAVFFSLIVYVLVFALVLTGLVTDYWISTTSLQRNEKVLPSSFVHGGLFYGERQLDWGLGPSHQYFSIYDEISQKVGYMNKVLWILTIFFLALGLLWSFIGLMVSLMNTVASEKRTILGPSGIYLWSLLSISSYSTSVIIFLLQYFSTIQKNVLLPDQLAAGFSSDQRTKLSFSFYLIIAAIGFLLIPLALLACSQSLPKHPKPKAPPMDTTVFMY